MAENFDNVIKKLESTVKKPSAAKTPAVLAVQMVDSKGKVIKEEKGAAAAEAQREEEKRKKKTNTLLEKIAKSMGGGKKPARDPKTGRFMAAGAGGVTFSKMLAAGAASGFAGALAGSTAMSLFKKGLLGAGIAAIVVAGVFATINQAQAGMDAWAKIQKGKGGTKDKVSGFIGGFLGGKGKGLWNALEKAFGTAAIAGMGAGALFGPPGLIIGALLGAVIGGISGYFGGDKVSTWVDGAVREFRNVLNLPELLSPEQKTLIKSSIDTMKKEIDEKKKENKELLQIINDASITFEERGKARAKLKENNENIRIMNKLLRAQEKRMAETELAYLTNKVKKDLFQLPLDRKTIRELKAELIKAKKTGNELEVNDLELQLTAAQSVLEKRKASIIAQNKKINEVQNNLDKKQLEVKDLEASSAAPMSLEWTEHYLRKLLPAIRLFWDGELKWQKEFVAKIKKDQETRNTEARHQQDRVEKLWKDMSGMFSSFWDGELAWQKKFKIGWEKRAAEPAARRAELKTKLIASFKDMSGLFSSFWDGELDWQKEFKKGWEKRAAEPAARRAELIAYFKDIAISLDTFMRTPNWANDLDAIPRSGAFSGVWTKIEDAEFFIKSSFNGIIDKAKNFFTKTTDWFKELFDTKPLTPRPGTDVFSGGVGGSAAGGPISAGRWGLVGELGPELILPNKGAHVFNAQRTQQMLQAGILRGMGGGAGGGVTSINTGGNVVSSPTTNYVGGSTFARRPIILAA